MTELTDANLDPNRIPDEGFELLWDKVQEHWDDDKVHGAFLEYARERLLLPEAGSRYRVIKETDPDRAEMADKKLTMLMLLALTLLESAREQPTTVPKWVSSIAYAVAAVFFVVLIRKVFGGR